MASEASSSLRELNPISTELADPRSIWCGCDLLQSKSRRKADSSGNLLIAPAHLIIGSSPMDERARTSAGQHASHAAYDHGVPHDVRSALRDRNRTRRSNRRGSAPHRPRVSVRKRAYRRRARACRRSGDAVRDPARARRNGFQSRCPVSNPTTARRAATSRPSPSTNDPRRQEA